MSARSVFYSVMMKKLDQQYAAIGSLDDKLSKAFGFVNTVLPVYIGLLIAEKSNLHRHPHWVISFGIGGGVIYSISLFLVYGSYKAVYWDWRPNRNALKERVELVSATQEEIESWVGDEISKALDVNDEILERKGTSLKLLLLLMPCEVLVLAVSAVASLF
jgi:hypothetical protein